LEEEVVLKTYFKKEQNLPKEWIQYRQFFAYYELAKNESFPSTKIKTTARIKLG